MKPSNKFKDLVELVSILRKECPWDRRQTHESLKDHLIEEAYEAVEAIDNEDFDELKKELGDLLLHIVFQSKMASESSEFTIDDVLQNISEKLIRRHPHVFESPGQEINDEKQVAENWEQIKLSEGKDSVLDGLPKHLPALIRARRMQEKAGNVGFDWSEWKLAWEKLDEELGEWKEAVDGQSRSGRKEEFGDLLFSLVNVGRLLDLDAEDSLRKANRKFEYRFRYIEEKLREKNLPIRDATLKEMDQLWNEAKKQES
ncbi:MAG: nucleoside triphosphate pyrophosphohydrolase [Balneolaceae bacterium]